MIKTTLKLDFKEPKAFQSVIRKFPNFCLGWELNDWKRHLLILYFESASVSRERFNSLRVSILLPIRPIPIQMKERGVFQQLEQKWSTVQDVSTCFPQESRKIEASMEHVLTLFGVWFIGILISGCACFGEIMISKLRDNQLPHLEAPWSCRSIRLQHSRIHNQWSP